MKQELFYIESSRGTERVFYQPYGWDQAGWELVRSESYQGIYRKYVVSLLGFIKDGKVIVKWLKENEGIESEAYFIVKRFDPTTHYYTQCYRGKINFATYNRKIDRIELGIEDSDFVTKVMNREDIPINLVKTTTLDGDSITPFSNEGVLVNLPERTDGLNNLFTLNAGTTYNGPHSIPFVLVSSLIPGFHTVADPSAYAGVLGSIFEADEDITLSLYVTLNVTVTATVVTTVMIAHYNSAGDLQSSVNLFQELIDPSTEIDLVDVGPHNFSLVQDDYINITLVYAGTPGDTTLPYTGSITVKSNPLVYPATTVNGVFYHEAFTRILQSITGEADPFYSDFLGRTDSELQTYESDGAGSLGVFIGGKQLRGFLVSDIPLTATLKEAFDSLKATLNIGMGIESGKVRIELLSYFFGVFIIQDSTPVELTFSDCKDIQEAVLADWVYNKISVGYSKFEPLGATGGLREYNTQIAYTDIIKTIKKELTLISPYRADDSGIQMARNEAKSGKDISTDEDNFILSVVRSESDIIAQTNQGFDSISGTVCNTGVYNVLYSPARNLRRHGYRLTGFLKLYQDSKIVFTKQEKDTRLISKETGGDSITETSDILVSDLVTPIWESTKYSFETPISQAIIDVIQLGSTGGISNMYGIVKFRQNSEDLIWKYGWILSIRVKSEGVKSTAKFELLKVDPTVSATFELS